MNTKDFNLWCDEWKNVKKIMLWGYGKICSLHMSDLISKFEIEAIIDNDKSKEGFTPEGIQIAHPDNIDLHGKRVVVVSAYDDVREQLMEMGLEEYKDFCDIRLFVSGRAWIDDKKVCLSELHISINTACTLNCKYCNMYIPFHKKHAVIYSFDQVKEQFDLLFKFVDKIYNLIILGGEPLINKDLSKIIDYLYENYFDYFEEVEVCTNGTIIPDEQLIKSLQRPKNLVSISDYSLDDAYREKFLKIKNLLDENNINNKWITTFDTHVQWKDFSFPYEPLNMSEEKAYENMCKCNPFYKGFNDSKFYFCHLVWSADKAGIAQECPQDYIDFTSLKSEDREQIVKMYVCCFDDNKYVSLCQKCGGRSKLNQKYLKPGVQKQV